MREFINIVKENDDDQIGATIQAAHINGWGGDCGQAAIAINTALFNGAGSYVGNFNVAFAEHDKLLGHIVVKYQGILWDCDGKPKSLEDIDDWGVLDVSDPDYIAYARSLGMVWNEVTASEADFFEIDEDEIRAHFPTDKLGSMINALTRV